MKEINIQMKKYNERLGEFEPLYPLTKIENVKGLSQGLTPEIIVNIETGFTVILKLKNTGFTMIQKSMNGKCIFNIPEFGIWNVSSDLGDGGNIYVDRVKIYEISIPQS